jgi:cytochrome b6-f complex iron-sulfur subunit
MARNTRRVARYIDSLLRGRRPPRFEPDDEELAALRQATAMSTLRDGVDTPTAGFVSGLRRRLEDQLDGTGNSRERWSRRRVLSRGVAAAAAVAAGIAIDRGGGLLTAPQSQELQPNQAAWVAVGKVQDVSYRKPLRFGAGGIEGFVFLSAGELRGVSAVCSHQGCLLQYRAQTMDLECPCHGATFSSSGELRSHRLLSAPAPLPTIAVRQRGGDIEVRVA